MRRIRSLAIWLAVALAVGAPLVVAAQSPLLQWRSAVYIAAGFAGIVALSLMVLQPLLVNGDLPGLGGRRGRRLHRWTGLALLAAVIAHVAGLWITSPPDVIDALTFTSPTPFSAWGVLAMWGLFAAALLAVLRPRFPARLRLWRFAHSALALAVVTSSVVHALLIDGTMGQLSKIAVSVLAVAAVIRAIGVLGSWAILRRRNIG